MSIFWLLKRSSIFPPLHQLPKDISKFTKTSIYHLVLTLSICKETGNIYLPTGYCISTLDLLKYGSNNSVHMSTLNKLTAISEVILHFKNILFQPPEERQVQNAKKIAWDWGKKKKKKNVRAWWRSKNFK